MFEYKGERMAVDSANTDLHGYGEAIRRELAKRLPSKKLKVLDVGTGFGINAAFLAARLPRGSEVWSVDPSEEVLENAKRSLGRGAAKVRFSKARADDLGFEDATFDSVVSVMVLHHLTGIGPAMEEMARVLKPGGILLVVDYKPEASHQLEFKSRHAREDFFTPRAAAAAIAEAGMKPKVQEHELWFLVEARKASARRRPAAERSSRGGRGR